jgi:hypothetical protein
MITIVTITTVTITTINIIITTTTTTTTTTITITTTTIIIIITIITIINIPDSFNYEIAGLLSLISSRGFQSLLHAPLVARAADSGPPSACAVPRISACFGCQTNPPGQRYAIHRNMIDDRLGRSIMSTHESIS